MLIVFFIFNFRACHISGDLAVIVNIPFGIFIFDCLRDKVVSVNF
jgi:hypothetical protein